MFVELLRVEGFTSFENVEWQPERLNVLIGPNGSGKSNLLRALDMIRASAAGKLSDFFIARGGFPRFLWGAISRDASFYIHMTPDGKPGPGITYYFRLSHVPGSSGLRVIEETIWYNDDGRFESLDRKGVALGSAAESALSAVELQREGPIPYHFQQQLKAWTIYQGLQVGEDAAIRRSAVDRLETRVAPDGQNLIPVLKTLYEGEFKEAIDSGMSAAFPNDFIELVFRTTEPSRVQLYLRRKYSARDDSAANLSEGTLRFLLLLTILATPDPPPLIAIDEPEAGLHPSMLPIIAEFAVTASNRTQVILSTHSLQMLDAFGDTLPAATIFSWKGDHTELKNVSGDELKKWVDEYSLGRFIFSGEAAAVL